MQTQRELTFKCGCGGQVSRRAGPAREYVCGSEVFALPDTVALNTCDRCNEVWVGLDDYPLVKSIQRNDEPLRVMSPEETARYWDAYLVRMGSPPLYSELERVRVDACKKAVPGK